MNIQSAEFTREATSATPVAPCRLCGTRLNTTFVDLGMSPLCESFLPASEVDQMEPYFPLHVLVCDSAFWCSSRSMSSPSRSSPNMPISRPISTSWVEHAQALLRGDHQAAWAGRRQPGRRAGQQRRLSAAAFPAARRAGARHRAGRQRRQGGGRQGHADPRRVLRRQRSPQQLVAEGKRADLIVGNNVLAQVPDLNDFVAGMTHPAEAGRRRSRWSSRTSSG